MFKYILKIFKFVSTDLLYIEVIYFFVVHALRTSSARFAKTQLLELYIKNMPIKLWYNLNLDYTKGGLRQMQFFAKCIRACRGYRFSPAVGTLCEASFACANTTGTPYGRKRTGGVGAIPHK